MPPSNSPLPRSIPFPTPPAVSPWWIGGSDEVPASQPPLNLRFERIGIEEGLSNSAAWHILQGSEGDMWFGAQDGLDRYDRQSFTIYRHDPEDPHVAHGLFFSFSVYDLTAIVVLLSAGACIHFSLRSYLELPPVGWTKSVLGIGCLLAVSALAVWQVSTNEMQIVDYNRELVIHGVQTRTGDIDQLDGRIEALMAEGDIPSLAAAIAVNDEIVWIRGYGEQDTPDQMHDIASMTKPFVVTTEWRVMSRGYQGHGGGYYAYSGAMFMVEEEQGAYGMVLLTNTEFDSRLLAQSAEKTAGARHHLLTFGRSCL